jgi:ribonuclease HIII
MRFRPIVWETRAVKIVMLKRQTLYTLALTPAQSEQLADWCEAHQWTFTSAPYAAYGYRAEGVHLTLYDSGKLVVQGKGTEDFVLQVLEPIITQKPQLGLEQLTHPEWFAPHAGLDESGKGDLFGPLVAACVIADGTMVEQWLQKGLKESKAVTSDARLFEMERWIRQTDGVIVETVYANMERYNQLYAQFGNLNRLLGWMHACALKNALQRRWVPTGLLDQFTAAPLVQHYFRSLCKNSALPATHALFAFQGTASCGEPSAVQQNNRCSIAPSRQTASQKQTLDANAFHLRQQVRAEADPVVAAASIIARATYVRQLQQLR